MQSKPMYPRNDLYTIYKKNIHDKVFSDRILDVTKKRTLEVMNFAINCCECWGASLDIGGGSGHYSIPLLSKFKKSIVVDVEKHEEHEYLKNKYSNFEFYNNFIEQIDFKEKFDFILLVDIFEHIVDINSFIKQIACLQEKSGVIYILTPNPLFCGPAEQSEIYYTKHENGHQRHYLKTEIVRIMNGYNYEIIYSGHEEAPLRQGVRILLKGLSRRDKILSDTFYLYKKIISPLLSVVYKPIIFFVEFCVYRNEYINRNNVETTRATAYIFKKLPTS